MAGEIHPSVIDRAGKVRLMLLDVDGVLTDGRIYVDADGREIKAFDVTDGHGIRMGQQAGLAFGIITGRRSAAVTHRATELDIEELHQRVLDKAGRLDEILERRGLDDEQVCFVGDDLIDIPIMRRAGFAVATPEARAEVLEVAHHVTSRSGGRGAVREAIEIVLKASGTWERVTERYFRS